MIPRRWRTPELELRVAFMLCGYSMRNLREPTVADDQAARELSRLLRKQARLAH